MILSKSRYLRGLQCPKALWLIKHRPDLRAESGKTQEVMFEKGRTVGKLARGLFGGGDRVRSR